MQNRWVLSSQERWVPWAMAFVATSSSPPRAWAQAGPAVSRSGAVRGADVHVTAPRGAGLTRDASVAGSVITRAQLEAPGLRASDVLRSQPGVQVADTGGFGAPATASIRGATAAQTPVYLGGIRLNDDVGGMSDLSLVPLWLVRRIEIYRGNAPLDADRLGIGGAVFFEPRQPTRTEAGLGAMVGSFGARSGWTYAGAAGKNASVLAGVRWEGARNDYPYLDDGGTLFDRRSDVVRQRANADARMTDSWALGRFTTSSTGHVSLLVNHLNKEQGVPLAALLSSREARVAAQRTLVGIDSRQTFGPGDRHRWQAHVAYIQSHLSYDDPLYELALGSTSTALKGQRIEQALHTQLALTDTFSLRPDVQVAVEQLVRQQQSQDALRARRVFSRAGAAAQWAPTPAVTLQALVSSECHGTEQAGRSSLCDIVAPTGRVGGSLTTGALVWLANAGRYVRIPTLGELYGISEVVRGSSTLRPENGWTLDVGVRAETPRSAKLRGAYVDLFLFHRQVDDLVTYVRTGQGIVVPRNVQRARVQGLELLTGTGLSTFLLAEVALTLTDPRETSTTRTTTNDILPYRSRLLATPRLRAEWNQVPLRGVNKLGMELRYTYQSSRYVDPAGLGVIPAQGFLDAEAEAHAFESHFHIRFRASNLLGATRTDLLGYPLPGRSFFVSTEITL